MKKIIKILIFYLIVIETSHAEIDFPEDGAILNYTHVMFRWKQEPDAQSYNLKILNQLYDPIVIIEVGETIYIDKNNFEWDNTYYAMINYVTANGITSEWSDTISFDIGSKLISSELEIEIIDDESMQEGLVLFSQVSPNFGMIVIDKVGNQVWNTDFAYINHWSEHGQLYGMRNSQGVEVNFYNEILWTTPLGSEIDAHEIKKIPNGNYMGITAEYQLGPIPLGPWTDSYQDLGFTGDGITNEFTWRGTKIVEWDKENNEEVWSWNPFQSYDMNDYDSLEGRWWSPLSAGSYGLAFDWNHINSFHFDALESMIYISSRNLSRITKVSYPENNLIWNMGPPSDFGYGDNNICPELLFSCQHHIQMLENGDLLFFDNGKLSELFLNDSVPTTRIRRINVSEDSSCETIWQYELPPELFGHSWGSVQLLENGNYFIYTHGSGYPEGSICTLLEVSPNQDLVWSASHTIPYSVWYRSYKIPSIHPSAFSLNVDNYHIVPMDTSDFSGIIVDESNPLLIFTIKNHSGYDQHYSYELLDQNQLYTSLSDTVYIEAGNQYTFISNADISNFTSTTIDLSVNVIHHKWDSRDLTYDVLYVPGILNGLNNTTIPSSYTLHQNYPNPFNPITTLKYDLPEDSFVDITVYDMLGNVVNNLVDKNQNSGSKSVQWNATNNQGESVSAGVYLYKIQAGDYSQTKKMVLLK